MALIPALAIKKTWLLLAGALCALSPLRSLQAQTLSGRVNDAETGLPVAYANVGIPGKGIGTATDEHGIFELSGSRLKAGDTLLISMLGYEPQRTVISGVDGAAAIIRISLAKKAGKLAEVIVLRKAYKNRRLGNRSRSKNISVGIQGLMLGCEIATLMKTHDRLTIIDSIRCNVAECTYDSVFFRLNIYEITEGRFVNVLQEPYYIFRPGKDVGQEMIIHLTREHPVVTHDFWVSIEVVKTPAKGKFFFSGSFGGAPTYIKTASQANWEQEPLVSAAISAYVRQ